MMRIHQQVRFAAAAVALGAAFAAGGLLSSGGLGAAHAQGTASPSTSAAGQTVTVTGRAAMAAPVDAVALQISMNDTQTAIAPISAQLQSVHSNIVAALAKAGVPATSVQTSNFNIWSQQGGSYNASEQMTVMLKSLSQALNVMNFVNRDSGKLVANGAVTLNFNTQFSASVSSVIRGKLFDMALQDAKSQAATLASDVGEQLGAVVSMSTATSQGNGSAYQNGPYIPTSTSTIGGVQNQQSPYGGAVSNVSAQVTVTYALVQQ